MQARSQNSFCETVGVKPVFMDEVMSRKSGKEP